MKNKKIRMVLVVLTALFLVVLSAPAWAALTWKGGTSDFFRKQNWTPSSDNSGPGSDDDVIINKAGSSQPILTKAAALKSLTLDTYSETLLTLGSYSAIGSDYFNNNWGTGADAATLSIRIREYLEPPA